jgi:hypothetical protein
LTHLDRPGGVGHHCAMPAQSIRERKRKRREAERAKRKARPAVDPFADPVHDASVDDPDAHWHQAGDPLESEDEPTGREAGSALGKIGSYVSMPGRRASGGRSAGSGARDVYGGTGTQSSPLQPVTLEQIADVVRQQVAEGSLTDASPQLHDVEAERRIVAAAAWGWLSPEALRSLRPAAMWSLANRHYYAALRRLRTEPRWRDVVLSDPSAQDWANRTGSLGEPEALWPELLVEVVRLCRDRGLRGPIAADLVAILEENAWRDMPALDSSCERVRDLAERRQLISLFRLSTARLATGTATPARVRQRIVEKLGGILP